MAHLRLTRILRQHEQKQGSIPILSEVIKNADPTGKGVTQGKLREIIRGNPIALKLSDLEALNNYLTPFGQSLGDVPLFDADGILRDLVAKQEVVFFAATRARDNREYTSVWDTRAFNNVVERINHRWPTTRISLREEVERFAKDAPSQQHWPQLLGDGDRSCCCLGGPRAFGLTEYMLAEMFGVEPFKPPPKVGPPLPFYFVWHPHPAGSKAVGVPSGFALEASDLPGTGFELPADQDLPGAIENRNAQAFLVREKQKIYPVWLDRPEWKEYGVIVAQRRKKGEVWVVLGGLSGTGTYAAAKVLGDISLAVPDTGLGQVSQPVYAIVEVAVRKDPKKSSGDAREVMGQKILVGPLVWG